MFCYLSIFVNISKILQKFLKYLVFSHFSLTNFGMKGNIIRASKSFWLNYYFFYVKNIKKTLNHHWLYTRFHLYQISKMLYLLKLVSFGSKLPKFFCIFFKKIEFTRMPTKNSSKSIFPSLFLSRIKSSALCLFIFFLMI